MSPSVSSQGRSRSRLGFVVFLLVAVLVAWEAVNLLVPATPARMTLSRFVRAAWAVANGETGGLDVIEVDDDKFAFRPLPYVMYGYKPGFERTGEPLRTANALGYRGGELSVPKPEGVTRIVCLGGSTTYSYAVADGEDYPAQLQLALAERRPDLDVEVVNAGVESYTSAESLANLAFRVLDLQPDAIVVYHAANDVRPRKYRNFDPSYTHYRQVWSGSTEGYEEVGGELNGVNFFIQHQPPQPTGREAENVHNAGPDAYRRNLLSMAGVARAHGVLPVFVTFAATPGPSALLGDTIDEHNGELRGLCEQHELACIDLAAGMQPLDESLFVDQVHMNAEGCRLKAGLIAADLAELLP